MFRIFILLVFSAVTANCATQNEKALQNRINQLEDQLAVQQIGGQAKPSRVIKAPDDPLYETYKILNRIQTSQVNEVSSLSYAQNVASPNVTIYPIGEKPQNVSTSKDLKERSEQYPRHLLQLGQDVYTEQQQENIVVFPIKDPAIEDLKPVEPATPLKKPGQKTSRLLSAPPEWSGAQSTRVDASSSSSQQNKQRRLTGY